MRTLPPEILARFDDILKVRDVPLFHRPAYRKWVRYFYYFQAKYPLPGERSVQVRMFSEKLRSKGQAEGQVEQAADAISLFFACQLKQQASPSVTIKGKGGKSRYVPILPELAQELRTHLGQRSTGYLFETNRHLPYSPRRIQQIVKATAEQAKIKKRVYPHLLRHSVATTLLERGMPIEQIQKFLGHAKLETTQVYAESTPEMIKNSYRRALAE